MMLTRKVNGHVTAVVVAAGVIVLLAAVERRLKAVQVATSRVRLQACSSIICTSCLHGN